MNIAENRRSFAAEVFKNFPGKIALEMQQRILAQQVVLGMAPYEAYLAAGKFTFKVVADPARWEVDEEPFRVMWAQSLHPDDSRIWMTFSTRTQYPEDGLHKFCVLFEKGRAAGIQKIE
jgi:hypothetical protein